ncbi:MAG: glycosyltransferase [Saprospiraceae bacterium]|nr:glycosyltransferase [Saprospiraceae bacterium]
MLSICIPVYEFDIRPLVQDLQKQCIEEGIEYEILCFDDASGEEWREMNRSVSDLPGVRWRESSKNIGRARMRNLLGATARHTYLLFTDCDVALPDDSYIRRYLDNLRPDAVICGGRVYPEDPPADRSKLLHWTFGRQREAMSAEVRRERPHYAFMTNNFVVPTDIFRAIGFEDSFSQYGHEDTLFGFRLMEKGVPIIHIDNPNIHIGIESAGVFLRKTGQSVENLYHLFKRGIPLSTRLLSTFRKVKRTGLAIPVYYVLHWSHKQIRARLMGRKPGIFFLDLWKLYCLLRLDRGEG